MVGQTSGDSYLDLLYDSLAVATKASGKKKNKSVLLSLLDVTNNTRIELLNKGSLGTINLSPIVVNELLKKGFMMESSETGRFVLTGRGLWEVESRRNILSTTDFVNYCDTKFFKTPTKAAPLSDRERVILLGMAAARSYGEDQTINMRQGDSVKEQWKSVFESSYDILQDMACLKKLKRDDLFGKPGIEHPVSNLVRHTDALPPKTKHIYRSLGNLQYCLDVVESGEISEQRLSSIFRLILPKEIDHLQATALNDFCQRVAHEDCMFIYTISENPFLSMKADEAVRSSLFNAISAI